MKKTRYTEDQIIGILKEAEAGIPIIELCRRYGPSAMRPTTTGRQNTARMTVSDAFEAEAV